MTDPQIRVLTPDWPAPPGVRAAFSLRQGGVSQGPWSALNLGVHVADDPAAVTENRRRLRQQLGLPAEPFWLSQVHGIAVANPDGAPVAAGAVAGLEPVGSGPVTADAAVTTQAGQVLAIQVADCLPVLFAARDGSAVAGAHAGWRGLAAGVLEATVAALAGRGVRPQQLLAWMGPAIGPECFEVGEEVRAAFVQGAPGAAAAFTPARPGHWLCDLRALAAQRLAAAGVGALYGVDRGLEWCTYSHPQQYFSHRRDGPCGRMAALVWMGA